MPCGVSALYSLEQSAHKGLDYLLGSRAKPWRTA